jgi:hypothetical protein
MDYNQKVEENQKAGDGYSQRAHLTLLATIADGVSWYQKTENSDSKFLVH